NHLITLAQGAKSHAADRRIQAGNVSASGQNSYDSLALVDVCHVVALRLGFEQIILHGHDMKPQRKCAPSCLRFELSVFGLSMLVGSGMLVTAQEAAIAEQKEIGAVTAGAGDVGKQCKRGIWMERSRPHERGLCRLPTSHSGQS